MCRHYKCILFLFIIIISATIFNKKVSAKDVQVSTLRMPHLCQKSGKTFSRLLSSKRLTFKDKEIILSILNHLDEPQDNVLRDVFIRCVRRTIRFFQQIIEKGGSLQWISPYYYNETLVRDRVSSFVIYPSFTGVLEPSEGMHDFTERNNRLYIEYRDKLYKLLINNKVEDFDRLVLKIKQYIQLDIIFQERYDNRKTLLHLACERGFFKIIDILLRNGCEANIRDNNGKKAYYYYLQRYVIFKDKNIDRGNAIVLLQNKTIGMIRDKYKFAIKNSDVALLAHCIMVAKNSEEFDKIIEYCQDSYVLYKTLEVFIIKEAKGFSDDIMKKIMEEYIRLSFSFREIVSTEKFVNRLEGDILNLENEYEVIKKRNRELSKEEYKDSYKEYESVIKASYESKEFKRIFFNDFKLEWLGLYRGYKKNINELIDKCKGDEYSEETVVNLVRYMLSNRKVLMGCKAFQGNLEILEDIERYNNSINRRKYGFNKIDRMFCEFICSKIVDKKKIATLKYEDLKRKVWECIDINYKSKKLFDLIKDEESIYEDFLEKVNNSIYCLNARNDDGNTLLIEAVRCNRIDIVRLLLRKGVDINSKKYEYEDGKSQFSYSALALAVNNSNFDMVRLLMQYGADINSKSSMGASVFLFSTLKSNRAIFKLLLSHKDLNLDDRALIFGGSALHIAALKNDDPYFLEELLKLKRLNINELSDEGYSPLHLAVVSKNIEKVKLLVKYGAVLDIKDQTGNTPLGLAAQSGAYKIALYLLEEMRIINSINYIFDAANKLVKATTKTLDYSKLLVKEDLFLLEIQRLKDKGWSIEYKERKEYRYKVAYLLIIPSKKQIALSDIYVEVLNTIKLFLPKEQYESSVKKLFVTQGKQNDFKNLIKPIERFINIKHRNIDVFYLKDVDAIKDELKMKFGIDMNQSHILEQLGSFYFRKQNKEKIQYIINLDCAQLIPTLINDKIISKKNNEFIVGDNYHIILRRGFRSLKDNTVNFIFNLAEQAEKKRVKIEWLLDADGINAVHGSLKLKQLVAMDVFKIAIIDIKGFLLIETDLRSELEDEFKKVTRKKFAPTDLCLLNKIFRKYITHIPCQPSHGEMKLLNTFQNTLLSYKKEPIGLKKVMNNIRSEFFLELHIRENEGMKKIEYITDIDTKISDYKYLRNVVFDSLFGSIAVRRFLLPNAFKKLYKREFAKKSYIQRRISNYLKLEFQYKYFSSLRFNSQSRCFVSS